MSSINSFHGNNSFYGSRRILWQQWFLWQRLVSIAVVVSMAAVVSVAGIVSIGELDSWQHWLSIATGVIIVKARWICIWQQDLSMAVVLEF